MIFDIPFGDELLHTELPEKNVIFYADTVKNDIFLDADTLIENALDNPYGTPKLEDMVNSSMKVVILSDDVTRPTPKKLLIEHIIARLHNAGVKDEDIMICIAPGTHRTMTDNELQKYFGEDLLLNHSFLNINYKNTDHFISLGTTPSGIPIEVYREVNNADFIIGIGNIVPHVSAGWGGGAKIIQPGICGEKTTEATHVIAALDQNVMETCGNADNLCRHEMEEVAKKVGLSFIVNTVMDVKENILGVFCGDFIEAHREGIKLAKTVQCPAIPEKADIVIASANPCNIDFWQGDKPFVFSQFALKDNGCLIFVISGEEGLCGNAPEHDYVVRHYGMLGEKRLRQDVESGIIQDLIAIDAPIHLEQVRDRNIKVYLVTKGFTKEDADALGFELTESLEEAIRLAFTRQGVHATIGIIPYCGETLVEVSES